MKQQKLAFILGLLIVFTTTLSAQDLSLKWSQEIKQKNSVDGYFKKYLGANDKYIYAYFSTLSKKKQYKIVAFDKKTMMKKHDVEVIGYPSNARETSKYKRIKFYKTIVYNDVVYAFYKSNYKGSTKILVKSFSPELKETNKLKVVTSQPAVSDRKNKAATPFVIGNKKVGKVFIGVEKEAKPGTKIKLEYKVLNQDFSFSNANQIELPIEFVSGNNFLARKGGLVSSYTYGDDGNVHFSSTYRKYDNKKDAKADVKKAKKSGKSKAEAYNDLSYDILSSIDLKNNEYNSVPLKAEGKRLFSTYRMVRKGVTRLYGYFSDFSRDKRGRDIHGIFYAVLNENYEVENLKFSKFDKKMLRDMYKTDKNDPDGGRKGGCCIIGKKGDTYANTGTVNPDYIIEDAVEGEDGSIYLITTIMYNYTVQVCTTDQNGNTTCRDEPRCYKGNVTTFKLDKEGNMVWGSNYDRSITYKSHYVYDVNAVHDDKGLYVIYGDQKMRETKKVFFWQLLKKIDRTYPLQYIYMDKSKGKIKKKTLNVNTSNTKRRQAKFVNPVRVTVIDNKFYVNDQTETLNPLGYASFACCYVWMMPELPYAFRFTSNKYGYFGTLEPK